MKWAEPPITADELEGQRDTEHVESIRQRIMDVAESLTWDYRDTLPQEVGDKYPHVLHPYHVRYGRFKAAVAQVLKPSTIFETGIGWGIAATAFLHGCPDAHYYGIDNGDIGLDMANVLSPIRPGSKVEWAKRSSREYLTSFTHPGGAIDLIHIDGGHGFDDKLHDVTMAFNARPEWILMDDCHDVMVLKGTADGIWKAGANGLKMIYFENSHTGSLLIHARRKEPASR